MWKEIYVTSRIFSTYFGIPSLRKIFSMEKDIANEQKSFSLE